MYFVVISGSRWCFQAYFIDRESHEVIFDDSINKNKAEVFWISGDYGVVFALCLNLNSFVKQSRMNL